MSRPLWALALGLLGLLLQLPGCSEHRGRTTGRGEQKHDVSRPLVVGFSQMETNYPWRIAESQSIKSEADRRGIKLHYSVADNSTERQIEDVKRLVARNLDYLLIAPREFAGLAPALRYAREKGVPVILIDRDAEGIPGVDYITKITADFVWEGYMGGKILAEHFKGRDFNLVEITGTPGSSVARDRSQGLRNAQTEYPRMHIIASETGEFVRSIAQEAMEKIIQEVGKNIQAVYAHCDESGIGAIQALKAAGDGFVPGKDVFVVSCAGEKDALKAIIAGELLATVECTPMFGPIVFDVIERIERGEKVETWIKNAGKIYDSSNAEKLFNEGF